MAPKWQTPTGTSVPALAALDEMMRTEMVGSKVPRGVLAVAKKGRLVLARGYTFAEDGVSKTQPNSQFRIASCSKTITLLAALQLIEQGRLDPAGKVQSYLQLTTPDGSQPSGKYLDVTVGDLMRHRSGIDAWALDRDTDAAFACNAQLPVTKWQMAKYLVSLNWNTPGQWKVYSNNDWYLLGLVIEKVSGDSYGRYCIENIFNRAGVTRARIAGSREDERFADEVAYLDSAGRRGPSVVHADGREVPFPYGVGNTTNADASGGWVLAAPDFVRVLSRFDTGVTNPLLGNPPAGKPAQSPWDPTWNDAWDAVNQRGTVTEHVKGGGMPGTTAVIFRRSDDVSVAAFFNMDFGSKEAIEDQVAKAINGVSWPAGDTFSNLGIPSPALPFSHWRTLDTKSFTATSGPGAALNADGGLAVFARGADNHIWSRWQTTKNGAWTAEWQSIGSAGGHAVSAPAAAVNADGGLTVFMRGNDTGIWCVSQVSRNGKWAEKWTSLAGWTSGSDTSAPAATLNADGGLVVFARGDDGSIWHRWQTTKNGSWTDKWYSLGTAGFTATSGPAAALSADGALVVFARGADGAIWHRWQVTRNGKWTDKWVSLGTPGFRAAGAPAAALTPDGRLVVFVRRDDGALWHRWQMTRNSTWTDHWVPFGGVVTTEPACALNAAGGLVVFAKSAGNAIWHRWRR